MARLMITLMFLALLVALAIGVTNGIGRAARAGQTQLAQARWGNGTMQKLSGIVLVALIIYVSVWGGA